MLFRDLQWTTLVGLVSNTFSRLGGLVCVKIYVGVNRLDGEDCGGLSEGDNCAVGIPASSSLVVFIRRSKKICQEKAKT